MLQCSSSRSLETRSSSSCSSKIAVCGASRVFSSSKVDARGDKLNRRRSNEVDGTCDGHAVYHTERPPLYSAHRVGLPCRVFFSSTSPLSAFSFPVLCPKLKLPRLSTLKQSIFEIVYSFSLAAIQLMFLDGNVAGLLSHRLLSIFRFHVLGRIL